MTGLSVCSPEQPLLTQRGSRQSDEAAYAQLASRLMDVLTVRVYLGMTWFAGYHDG